MAPGFLSLKSSKHQAAQAPSADGHLFVKRDKSRSSRAAATDSISNSNADESAAVAAEEFVDHWCVLRDGLLNAYRVSDAFDPRTDALPAKPSLSCDVTTLR
jgi:hypothetical protein